MIDCERCGELINVVAGNGVLNVNETTGGDRVIDSDTVVPSTLKLMILLMRLELLMIHSLGEMMQLVMVI